jgi:hypothetical protein
MSRQITKESIIEYEKLNYNTKCTFKIKHIFHLLDNLKMYNKQD